MKWLEKRFKMTDRPDEALGMVWKEVDEALGKIELAEELRNRSVMVLDELLTNICSYGICSYGAGEDPDRDPVTAEVRFEIDENLTSLRILVEDSGIPFNPLTTMERDDDFSDEYFSDDGQVSAGMGLQLVRQWSDELQYEYRGGRNRLEVLLKSREEA